MIPCDKGYQLVSETHTVYLLSGGSCMRSRLLNIVCKTVTENSW